METVYTIKPLKGYNAFQDAFNLGKTKNSAKATITLVFGDSDSISLGVGISKKRAKKAVVRNRVKRLLRESIRKLNSEFSLPKNIKTITVFWKIAPKHPMEIRLNEVLSELRLLISKY
ncbi:ribonuclease P protein component [Candidatus Kapabacteria bacterium]|nr:ribonuclease P protein component [Candidatus Kapabacteria bacterium]